MDFRFNWKISLFCLVFLVIFMNLGLWQLDREKEKRELLVEREELRNADPMTAGELATREEWIGRPVRLVGEYDPAVILLQDNRVFEGQVGFEVLQRFHESSGRDFLVNRGFVPIKRTRDELPDIPPVSGEQQITGLIREPGKPLLLGDSIQDPGYPRIVQSIDLAELKAAGLDVFPGIVRLDADQAGALPRYWPDVVMQPVQHRGYAIQWFAMAFAISLAWLFFSFRKKEST